MKHKRLSAFVLASAMMLTAIFSITPTFAQAEDEGAELTTVPQLTLEDLGTPTPGIAGKAAMDRYEKPAVYELYRSNRSDDGFAYVGSTVDTNITSIKKVEYTDRGLAASTTYYYKFKLIFKDGNTVDSKVFSFTTGATSPTNTRGNSQILLSNVTSNSVRLFWDIPAVELKDDIQVPSYTVLRTTKENALDGGNYQTLTESAQPFIVEEKYENPLMYGPVYTDNTVEPGKTYYYFFFKTGEASNSENISYVQEVKIPEQTDPTPTPTESPIPTPTSTAQPTPTQEPTATPTSTTEPTPTQEPTATPTETVQPTPTQEPTATPTETVQPTPTQEPTATPTETVQPTPTQEPTATPTETVQPTPTQEPTATPTETVQPTPTQEPTATPTETAQPTATQPPTETPTTDPTQTPQPTATLAPAAGIPLPPTSLNLKANTSSSIALTWRASRKATGYNIYRGDSQDGSYELIGTVGNVTTYVDEGAYADSTTWYYVTAINADGEGNPSARKKLMLRTAITPRIENIRVFGRDMLMVRWKSVSTVNTFTVYRSTDGTNYTQIANTFGVLHTDTDVEKDTIYWYKIVADNGEEGIISTQPAAY